MSHGLEVSVIPLKLNQFKIEGDNTSKVLIGN